MPPIGDLNILVPVDVSVAEPPTLDVIDVLQPFGVVLLGYFPVPDQAEPALIKDQYEPEAAERLDTIAGDRDVTEVLVFTHDRGATIDRVADEYDCDVVLTAGDAVDIDRILVPLRGEANLERIVSVVGGLLGGSDAAATLFHAGGASDETDQPVSLLRTAADRLVDQGIARDRIEERVSDHDDVHEAVVELEPDFDLVVLGETEPSLRERILGDIPSRIVDDLRIPVLIVRDTE